ncbi:dimethyladenosine transferase [Dimargaris cristalligena]|uniref:rRNA adenine N(6)-methyltransferase n=1 Tax=Dimargaris cristalligena TaxID=215637 RepID=A0A4P9ZTM7_9FUNG|nr:dimethyladenosine transferase [Dimargaris cristalligena]|eukprot:RKP35890.1 dimethyladenosine transferase [Dimargaris cristalligena]
MPKVTRRQIRKAVVETEGFIAEATGGAKGKKAAGKGGEGESRHFGPLFNKDLGQHILKNPLVAQGIVDKAGVKATDTVVEVGPGTGNLTVRILEQAKKVIACEADPRLAAELLKRVQGTPYERRLEILHGDVMKRDLPYFDVCISNTPYQISSPLVFKLLEHRPLFRCAVLMFQREFALRLLAKPGDELYCRLSVNAQLYSKIEHVMKVESSVVRIEPYNPPPSVNFPEWDGLMRILFTRKNRTLRANFMTKSILNIIEQNYRTFHATQNMMMEDDFDMKAIIQKVLDDQEVSDMRAAKLGQHALLKLLNAFNEANIHFC